MFLVEIWMLQPLEATPFCTKASEENIIHVEIG